MLGVLLLSVVLAVRLTVLLSYQGNDMYTALQKAFQGIAAGRRAVKQSGIHGFWMSLAHFQRDGHALRHPVHGSTFT